MNAIELERRRIETLCKQIETEYNVKIIFAVESGSLVYGFPSKDSDRDIRFVYYFPFTYPFEEYITYKEQKMNIERMYDFDLNPITKETKGLILDLVGWNIFKYAKLLSNSNPMSIEWLNSPILYYGEIPEDFLNYTNENFKPIALFHHYYNIAKQNYSKQAKKETISFKKYFYPLMGAFKALYVNHYEKIPPLNLQDVLKGIASLIPEELINKCYKLIEIKKGGNEKDQKKRIDLFDDFLGTFIDEYKEIPEKLRPQKYDPKHNLLNEIIRKIILKDYK